MTEDEYYDNMYICLKEHFPREDVIRFLYLYQQKILTKFTLEWIIYCEHERQKEAAGCPRTEDVYNDLLAKWKERI